MKAEKNEKAEELKQKRLQKELEKKQREERKRQLEVERQEKKEQAEREKEAKRIKLEEERKAKNEQKLREQREKEEQRLKREEEKRKEREAREEERRKKEEERRKKEEEKQKKEDERQKKLDDKRLLEEMKQRKEVEEKEKKEKEQNRFLSFFKKDGKTSLGSDPQINNSFENSSTIFKPFQLKPNQSLATMVPDCIKQRFDSDRLDELIVLQNTSTDDLYINQLKNGYQGYKRKKDKQVGGDVVVDDDVLVDDDPQKMHKAKLFQFHENNRPPYFGTWSKKSHIVSGRKPFCKDEVFNYEVDSDDEWEEEEKGESIKDNDSELSEEEGDGYELDDMFVSHGYLSDDELKAEEGSAETERGGILCKEEVLFEEKKKAVKKLQPLIIGCIWRDTASNKNSLKILEQYSATYLSL